MGLAEQDPEAQDRNAVVAQALRDLGWIVGRNLHIDYRYTIGDDRPFAAQAAELIALAPDVLLANNTPATRALQQATSTIPIVYDASRRDLSMAAQIGSQLNHEKPPAGKSPPTSVRYMAASQVHTRLRFPSPAPPGPPGARPASPCNRTAVLPLD